MDRFGALRGISPRMRSTFELLDAAARSELTVLLEGETGTGKDSAAAAIHRASRRAAGPYVIIDCGAIPATLLESELFGYERGAFTGATGPRAGAFAEAHGGTVLLDEIGELPLELQPKLLRFIEQKHFRRLGSTQLEECDVRIVAATNRDLRAEVEREVFRADLFYRLAVLRVTLPPLRERPEDIPLLAEELLRAAGATPERQPAFFAPEFFARLGRCAWRGNVRELRNYLESCVALDKVLPLPSPPERLLSPPEGQTRPARYVEVDCDIPYAEARARCIAAFEGVYAREALRRSGGNIARAASAAQIDRTHMWRLVKRSGVVH